MTQKQKLIAIISASIGGFVLVTLIGTTILIATREDVRERLGISDTSSQEQTSDDSEPVRESPTEDPMVQDDQDIKQEDEDTAMGNDALIEDPQTEVDPATETVEPATIQTQYAQAFRAGSNSLSLNIRNDACGDLIGSTFWGNVGKVVGEPKTATCFGREYTWRMIEWEQGVSGWSIIDNLQINSSRSAFVSDPSAVQLQFQSAFGKEVIVGGGECGIPGTITRYSGSSSNMVVLTPNDVAKSNTESVQSFQKVLRRTASNSDHINARLMFEPGCSGYGSGELQYLEGIGYPGLDHHAFTISLNGQGLGGTVLLRLFGMRGQSKILVTMPVQISEAEYDSYFGECFGDVSGPANEAQFNCYRDKLYQPKHIAQARRQAQKIATDYALK